MKIGNIVISRKFILSFTMICLVVSVVVGYSYINTDFLSIANVTVKGQQRQTVTCNQTNLHDRIACSAVLDSKASEFVTSKYGINFGENSSDTNGKGVYTFTNSISDTYPVHYFRGNVDNNNVIFGDYCWKIVRTTDTGGTKLVYNGKPMKVYPNGEALEESSYTNLVNDATNAYVFDEDTKMWSTPNDTSGSIASKTFSFSVAEAGNYNFNYNLVSPNADNQNQPFSFYLDGNLLDIPKGGNAQGSIDLTNLSASSVITIRFFGYFTPGNSSVTSVNGLSFNLEKSTSPYVLHCREKGGSTLSQIGTSAYNSNYNSPAYVGYMYGTVYEPKSDKDTSGGYTYGSSFTFVDDDPNVSGDGTYTLTSTETDTDQLNTHHYTCFNVGGTCSELYYIYYKSGTTLYYISLTDGKSVEDAINEMNTNTNDSAIKTAVDSWFSNTFATYFTTNSKDYNNYLEDTIWCNDRSMNTLQYPDVSYESVSNGWIPANGKLDSRLYFGGHGRMYIKNLSVSCPNKNDSFTVTETTKGNGALDYPVGLLTAEEIRMAGAYDTSYNPADYYLATGERWYTITPAFFYGTSPAVYTVGREGGVNSDTGDRYGGWVVLADTRGVRPAISLKNSVVISSGVGSATNPYIID